MGRHTEFNHDIADLICERIAEGQSIRTICREEDMPAMSTIFKWLRTQPSFSEQYEKAKAEQAEALVEEMLEIADDGTNDWMEKFGKDGENLGYIVNGEHIQRSRLRLDARKWIASKLKPKKYSDKVDIDMKANVNAQLSVSDSDRDIINQFINKEK